MKFHTEIKIVADGNIPSKENNIVAFEEIKKIFTAQYLGDYLLEILEEDPFDKDFCTVKVKVNKLRVEDS